MSALLDRGWSDVFDASLTGSWQPEHLGVEQLIKHALALTSRFPDSRRHLVYVWWEPTNADQIPELVIHRQEVNDDPTAPRRRVPAPARADLHRATRRVGEARRPVDSRAHRTAAGALLDGDLSIESVLNPQALHGVLAIGLRRQAVAPRGLQPAMPGELGDEHDIRAATHQARKARVAQRMR